MNDERCEPGRVANVADGTIHVTWTDAVADVCKRHGMRIVLSVAKDLDGDGLGVSLRWIECDGVPVIVSMNGAVQGSSE